MGGQGWVKDSGKTRNTILIVIRIWILQWNARSLIGGLMARTFRGKKQTCCVSRIGDKTSLELIINGYVAIRWDRKGGARGGCVTFVKECISYWTTGTGTELQSVVMKYWQKGRTRWLYNPRRKMTTQQIWGNWRNKKEDALCGVETSAHMICYGGVIKLITIAR